MRALVTGADGFIGSHLTEFLLSQGHRVKALAQYNSFNNWGWLEDIPLSSELEVVCGDIRDQHFCQDLCQEIDIVFHLAALISIPFSYIAPESFIDTNVKGTLNICQAALKNNVKRIVCTSTSEVYGTALYVPMDEKHPLQAQSPYSASKIGADAVAMSFYNTFGLPLTIARPFNTYGPRQSARAVIPTIITQIASGQKEIKLGDVSPTRDFNYVADTCRAFIELADCDQAVGETVNIGSNYEISIRDVINMIQDIMHKEVSIVEEDQRIRPARSEVRRLWCDNSKIFILTGFSPAISIRQGLELTVEWFRDTDNLAKYKAPLYNR